jgi:hypothetical protein
MCELVIVVALCFAIANQAKNKGRAGWPYVLLLIALWLFGEIAGAVLAVIAVQGGSSDVSSDGGRGLAYGCAIVGAIIGVATAFIILAALPEVARRRSGSYDDDYGRGGYGRRSSRDYDDDRQPPWDRELPSGATEKFGERRSPPPDDRDFGRPDDDRGERYRPGS